MKKSLLILTGHTKGLGKAILEGFLLQENFQILAVSRSGLDMRNDNLTQVNLDLSDLEALEAKLPEIFPAGEFKKVILINNAGWIGEVKPVGKLEPRAIAKAMSLNTVAPMILVDAFVKAYSDSKSERLICNISSGAARKPMPGWAEYCSSKAGLEMYSKVVAEDLREKGFRVFSLAPGIVDTEMQAEIRTANPSDFPALERFTDFKSEGMLSTPQEVAEKIFYLLSNPELFNDVVQDVRNFEAH
ncbi:SDR family oxidoreductase [Algoriphagus jejuensis]|uniref:SDR family oxidoreductase n=1 Tax=Algoriphagus jejuensis TaxID=419934 RepID=A0ABN1MZ59_9BACT